MLGMALWGHIEQAAHKPLPRPPAIRLTAVKSGVQHGGPLPAAPSDLENLHIPATAQTGAQIPEIAADAPPWLAAEDLPIEGNPQGAARLGEIVGGHSGCRFRLGH
jgi:hypothetical protein